MDTEDTENTKSTVKELVIKVKEFVRFGVHCTNL